MNLLGKIYGTVADKVQHCIDRFYDEPHEMREIKSTYRRTKDSSLVITLLNTYIDALNRLPKKDEREGMYLEHATELGLYAVKRLPRIVPEQSVENLGRILITRYGGTNLVKKILYAYGDAIREEIKKEDGNRSEFSKKTKANSMAKAEQNYLKACRALGLMIPDNKEEMKAATQAVPEHVSNN